MKSRFLKQWKWWKRHSIREQIFMSMLFLTVLAIGVLGMISYHMEKVTIEENYRQSYETTLRNSSKILDLKLKPVIDKGRSILTEEPLWELLNGSREYVGNEFSVEDQKKMEQILGNITFQEEAVSSVAVMDFYGHYFFLSNINKGAYEFYNFYKNHDFRQESWYMETQKAAGKEVFWGNGVLGEKEDENVFCLTKILNNPETGSPMGCMVINLSRRMLGESIVEGDEGYETSAYLIVDEKRKNQLVYMNGENEEKEQIMQEFSGGGIKKQSMYLVLQKIKQQIGVL